MTTRQREPREHDPKYLGWIAGLPCVACFAQSGLFKRGVHVAHLRASSLEHGKRQVGKAEKPDDRWSTPLCPAHHVYGPRSQHHYPGGEEPFWQDLGLNPFDLCIALRAAYKAGASGVTVIMNFVAAAHRARLAGDGAAP